MRNGSIDVTYSAVPGTSVDRQVEEVLEKVIAHSRAAGNTRRLSCRAVPLVRAPRGASERCKGKSGVMRALRVAARHQHHCADREERAFGDRRARSGGHRRSGVAVWDGTDADPVPAEASRLGAENRTARDVLWRALQSMSPSLCLAATVSWPVTRASALNIHGRVTAVELALANIADTSQKPKAESWKLEAGSWELKAGS